MSSKLLSIVIPVFGVENYIKDFLDSILHQNTPEIEFIFVNDGTKDNSINILQNYLKYVDLSFGNIHLYHQENQGQSVARNFGISVSQGEYVTFLDPDDLVAENYIYKILSIIRNSKPDIVNYNACSFFGNKRRKLKLCETNYSGPVSEQNLNIIFQKCMWFSWLRVFKRSLLTENFFEIGVNYQDMISIPRYYFKCNNMINIIDELVEYRIHPYSSVNSFKPKLIFSAERGISCYSDWNSRLEYCVYLHFIRLRLNLGFNNIGFELTTKWFLNLFLKSKDKDKKLIFIYLKTLLLSMIKRILR